MHHQKSLTKSSSCAWDKGNTILEHAAYVGTNIPDLSNYKTLMYYDIRYNYFKENYNDKAKLLFPDTDSLTNEIETKDVCLLEKKIDLTIVITPKIVN